jgi:hypothetical protein
MLRWVSVHQVSLSLFYVNGSSSRQYLKTVTAQNGGTLKVRVNLKESHPMFGVVYS